MHPNPVILADGVRQVQYRPERGPYGTGMARRRFVPDGPGAPPRAREQVSRTGTRMG
ncbi:hypothetical protein TOK_2498 [Pseudonocardia sp. N23]|nr:hypothetical protein TOK_2498 [Pseudonocardia sp. N23]